MYYSINLDMSMSNKAKNIDKKLSPQSMFSNPRVDKENNLREKGYTERGQKDSLKNIWILLMRGQLLPHQINIPLDDTIEQDQVWNTLKDSHTSNL